jgi:hypothetical protein
VGDAMIFDDYYAWLLDKVKMPHGEYENYSLLMQYLYTNDFRYFLIMDSNRAEGGLALRSIYADEAGVYLEDVKDGECSILEMLISLAENMHMNADRPTSEWFWEMISNLGLLAYDDSSYDEIRVERILDRWMFREFDKSGHGSIFPIPNSYDLQEDMRGMEIWNQMNKYLLVNYPVGDWIK